MDYIVRETVDLVEIFREHAAKGDIFLLDDLLGYFMMDVIGAVTLNYQTAFKRGYNQLGSSMRSQVSGTLRMVNYNIFTRWNPRSTFSSVVQQPTDEQLHIKRAG